MNPSRSALLKAQQVDHSLCRLRILIFKPVHCGASCEKHANPTQSGPRPPLLINSKPPKSLQTCIKKGMCLELCTNCIYGLCKNHFPLKNYCSQVTRLEKNKKTRARRAEQNRDGERPLKALQSLLFATEQFVFLFQSFIVPNALEIKIIIIKKKKKKKF
jgi:hypothetical protein